MFYIFFGYVGGDNDQSSRSLKFDESLEVPFFQVLSNGLFTDSCELFAIISKALFLLLLFLPDIILLYRFLLKTDEELAKLKLN